MYKDSNRLFRFVLITIAALTTFFCFTSCEVEPYKCRQVTYLNGEAYSWTEWEAPNFSECYCSEYTYQSGEYFFEVRCE